VLIDFVDKAAEVNGPVTLRSPIRPCVAVNESACICVPVKFITERTVLAMVDAFSTSTVTVGATIMFDVTLMA